MMDSELARQADDECLSEFRIRVAVINDDTAFLDLCGICWKQTAAICRERTRVFLKDMRPAPVSLDISGLAVKSALDNPEPLTLDRETPKPFDIGVLLDTVARMLPDQSVPRGARPPSSATVHARAAAEK